MLEKNIEKQKRKNNRQMWTPYYQRIVKNKKQYQRHTKHKENLDY